MNWWETNPNRANPFTFDISEQKYHFTWKIFSLTTKWLRFWWLKWLSIFNMHRVNCASKRQSLNPSLIRDHGTVLSHLPRPTYPRDQASKGCPYKEGTLQGGKCPYKADIAAIATTCHTITPVSHRRKLWNIKMLIEFLMVERLNHMYTRFSNRYLCIGDKSAELLQH